MDNRRSAYRVPFSVEAELKYRGRVAPCLVINMSAGGMLLSSGIDVPVGAEVDLVLRLFGDLRSAAGVDLLAFDLEVLEVLVDPVEEVTERQYRCRNLTEPDTPQWERAWKVVFAAERQRLAAGSGMQDASPMVTDPSRRKRADEPQRFGRSSINPLHGE